MIDGSMLSLEENIAITKKDCEVNKEKGNVFDLPKFIQNKLMNYLREKMKLSKM